MRRAKMTGYDAGYTAAAQRFSEVMTAEEIVAAVNKCAWSIAYRYGYRVPAETSFWLMTDDAMSKAWVAACEAYNILTGQFAYEALRALGLRPSSEIYRAPEPVIEVQDFVEPVPE